MAKFVGIIKTSRGKDDYYENKIQVTITDETVPKTIITIGNKSIVLVSDELEELGGFIVNACIIMKGQSHE